MLAAQSTGRAIFEKAYFSISSKWKILQMKSYAFKTLKNILWVNYHQQNVIGIHRQTTHPSFVTFVTYYIILGQYQIISGILYNFQYKACYGKHTLMGIVCQIKMERRGWLVCLTQDVNKCETNVEIGKFIFHWKVAYRTFIQILFEKRQSLNQPEEFW